MINNSHLSHFKLDYDMLCQDDLKHERKQTISVSERLKMKYEYKGKSIFPIIKVRAVSFNHHKKYQVFELCIKKTYDVERLKVTTKEIKDGTFEILDGYEELTGSLIIESKVK